MIAVRIVVAVAALLPAFLAAGADAVDVHGEWWTPGFNARVRLAPCGNAICGTVVWAWDNQPAGIADSRGLVGQPIISAMLREADGRWRGGRIYDPEDGRDYSGSLALKGEHNLVVEGCVLMFCRTQVWRRHYPRECPPDRAAARRTTDG